MTKKLLKLLLSIAIVLTSTVTVCAVDLDDDPTVAEILDTVDGGFPMLEYSTIPENAWVNRDGKQLFLNATKDQLLTDDGGSFETRFSTKKSNNDYIWSLVGITITFIMDSNNELSSIKINGLSYPYDGTYVAPSKTVASILATVEGGFPTYSDDVPSNAWKNENLKSIYLNASKTELFLDDGKSSFETDIVASKDKNKNVYSYSPYFGVTATFFMDDNSRLSSIKFDGLPDDPYADYNGTYVAPTTAEYTVTYNANGAISGTVPANQTKTAGVDLALATNTGNLAKTDYTFTGWNTQADGKGTHYDAGATYTIDADLNLYTEWSVVETKTIAQVLATVPGGFPTSTTNVGPYNSWRKDGDIDRKLYVTSYQTDSPTKLFCGAEWITSLDRNVSMNADGNYVLSSPAITLTFIMSNNKLASVDVNFASGSNYNGTYVSPTLINEVSFEYEDFDFSDFTFDSPTPGSAEYTIPGAELILLKGGEAKYHYYYTDGKWHPNGSDDIVTPKLADIDQAAAIVEIKTSDTNIFDSLTTEVTADNKDGSSKVLRRLQDVSDAKNGEGFERYDDQTLYCCLIFDAPVIKEVNINYSEFDFLEFKMEPPTVPTDAKYVIDPETSYVVCLLDKDDQPLAYSEYDKDVWYEDYAMSTPTEIEEIKDEVVYGSISFPVLAKDGFIFGTDLIVKANGKSLNPGDFLKIVEGLQEGYTLDADNDDGIFCLMFKRYEITEGNEAVINVDNNKDVLFVSNAPYDKFYVDKQLVGKVLVDDNEVASTNYAVEEGSTKVTLKASYLSTLSNGKHTLTIVSTDGNASTTFTITRNAKPSPTPGPAVPNTGVCETRTNNHSLLKISTLLVIGTYIATKRKKDN